MAFMVNYKRVRLLSLLLLLICTALFSEFQLERYYQKGVIPLVEDHSYLQNNPSPIYWTLSSYFIGQKDDNSCSLACATMALNSIELLRGMTKWDRITQPYLLQKVDNESFWAERMTEDSIGVSLDELVDLLQNSCAVLNIDKTEIQAHHVDGQSQLELTVLKQALTHSEKTGKSIIIANFTQSIFIKHPSSEIGHFALIGAYDEERERVLLLDPDRSTTEPYWVDFSLLCEGMATIDNDSGRSRGFIWITVDDKERH
jgi:hypothetical protein